MLTSRRSFAVHAFLRVLRLTFLMVMMSAGLSDAEDVEMVPDQQDGDSAAKAQTPKKEDEQEPVATFKARSDLVQQFFNVKGKNGGLIAGLTKDDFDVLENGKPQTIKFFTANTDLPLTLGILIDTSLSQQNVLGMEQLAGGAFLSQVLKDKDQAFVMDLNVRVSLVQDFTSSVRRLKDALNSVSSEMKKLTAETGGRAIDVGDNAQKLKAAFQQISDELRSQYNIGYVPTNTKRDGSFRKVEIKPKQDYKIQTRSGYFAIGE